MCVTVKSPQNTPNSAVDHHHDRHTMSDEPRPSKRRRVAPARYHGLLMYDKRLRDILPQPAPALSPSSSLSSNPEPPLVTAVSTTQPTPTTISVIPPGPSALDTLHPPMSDIDNLSIDTAHNAFGIFRRYYGQELPTHDPEREVSLALLSNIPLPPSAPDAQEPSKTSDFYPYPNQSSFLLADWYWNHGVQKSQESFKKLLGIVGNIDFSAHHVRETNWSQINRQLAVNDWDEGAWVDEDASWQRSAITIRVPFHRFLDYPGVQDYTIPDFYHRSLTSVIRERIKKDAENNCHFHFEPYELLWKPNIGSLADAQAYGLRLGTESSDSPTVTIRLYGELYTSPAFISAHRELQSITGEPNCNLPRVVVGLMFWSDGTFLTTYGNAKLWPLYMAFGNDSKYQRCKPSSNLYEHVAYFEQVFQYISFK